MTNPTYLLITWPLNPMKGFCIESVVEQNLICCYLKWSWKALALQLVQTSLPKTPPFPYKASPCSFHTVSSCRTEKCYRQKNCKTLHDCETEKGLGWQQSETAFFVLALEHGPLLSHLHTNVLTAGIGVGVPSTLHSYVAMNKFPNANAHLFFFSYIIFGDTAGNITLCATCMHSAQSLAHRVK